MKRNNLILLLAALIFASFTACSSDDDDDVAAKATKVLDVKDTNLKDANDWKYFSFSQGKFIEVSDPKTSNDWDLGIHYESFKTNSGKAGNGKGGILDMGAKTFDEVKFAPVDGYVADDSITIYQHGTQSPMPTPVKVAGCEKLEACFKSPTGPGTRTYEPNKHIYIIKTGDGKYVKFLATSFFNEEAVEGYINCVYQFIDVSQAK